MKKAMDLERLRKRVQELEEEVRSLADEASRQSSARLGAEEALARERRQLLSLFACLGEVAHDFNNILQAVAGFTELSLKLMAENEPAARHLRSVLEARVRASGLVDRIIAFCREGEGERLEDFSPAAPPCSEPLEEEPPPPAPAPGGGKVRVLFVDDEVMNVRVWGISLKQEGFVVTTCTDGRSALKRFLRDSGGFDVIVTDHAMPGMTGTELARECLGIRPDIPIILCTGWQIVSEQQAGLNGIREVIMKPHSLDTLSRAILRVVGPREPRL